MKLIHIILTATLLAAIFISFLSNRHLSANKEKSTWWNIQSIDTMKYSRDVAREKLDDISFDKTIDQQVKDIAAAGATHIALGTPYDQEFLPFLTRWVKTARKHGLNVWFRGNWSGWQQWFEYPPITRNEHIEKTKNFILENRNLFQDGDLFSSCPECENGGPGDPRRNRDLQGHRQFLIAEYKQTKEAFEKIGKQVASNYYSMNGDVARLVMDKQTTAALDGIVVIDHYVATPNQLALDIRAIAAQSGGKVVLGEFGAPIPNIHGNLTEEEQATWIKQALENISQVPQLVGVNYWVNVGGSTQLWDSKGKPRKAVNHLNQYYSPHIITGKITNQIRMPIKNALISTGSKTIESDSRGTFELPFVPSLTSINITAPQYQDQKLTIDSNQAKLNIILEKTEESRWFKLAKFFHDLIPRFSS